jgi:large subunit ribosomal protein L6
LKGIEKYRVNQTAVDIRALQAPDVYKGKGIRYKDEIILLKKGKEEPSN